MTTTLDRLMTQNGVTNKALAERLGVSTAAVTCSA